MRLELQAELFRRYPNFFCKPGKRQIASQIFDDSEQDTRDEMTSFDERGIECGDGWFSIVDRLSKACEDEIKMLMALGLEEKCWPRAAQIKEKLGGLRFYVKGSISSQLRHQILQAHAEDGESYLTCERCGAVGRLRHGRWQRTFCDHCEAEESRCRQ